MRGLILFLCLSFAFTLKAQKPELKNGLQRFVDDHVIYPMFALENCVQGTIEVAFKVNKAGEITYATVSKGIGADLDAEALRLIKLSSGKWELPVNYDVDFLVHVPMNFTLEGYGCEEVSAANVGLALNRYRERAVTLDKIVAFYKNLKQGLPNSIAEATVADWKTELEINEDYLAKRIAIAERKIKQGDLQSACEDFIFVKSMGSTLADQLIAKYCK